MLELSVSGAFLPLGHGVVRPVAAIGAQVHPVFARQLESWLNGLRWYPCTSGGFQVTSALALLWQFVHDTGGLPPFWFEGQWRMVDDEEANHFVVPSAPALYRTWVRALGSVTLEAGELGMVSRDNGNDGLPFSFGTFATGCLPLAMEVVEDLLALASRSTALKLIRLPAFW